MIALWKWSAAALMLGGMLVWETAQQEDAAPADPEEKVDSAATAEFEIPEKEKPFWESAQKFVDAYAARDAKAIGELFTEDAEFFDEYGELTTGRDAIVDLFQSVFDEAPEARLDEINLQKVRYVAPNVAIEEGLVVATPMPGAASQLSRYIAVHVREDDEIWRIDTLKDYRQEGLGRQEQLQRLAWLVGDWVSEDSDSVVETRCGWSEDGNFLLREFTVHIAGRDVMTGVQRIGWDPVRKELRSWMFDSEGGFSQGTWKQAGPRWIVVANGVTAEGETANGTAVYNIIDSEMFTWQYQNMVIGSEFIADIDPIMMIRQPPEPGNE